MWIRLNMRNLGMEEAADPESETCIGEKRRKDFVYVSEGHLAGGIRRYMF
jgi:hypothetical protein